MLSDAKLVDVRPVEVVVDWVEAEGTICIYVTDFTSGAKGTLFICNTILYCGRSITGFFLLSSYQPLFPESDFPSSLESAWPPSTLTSIRSLLTSLMSIVPLSFSSINVIESSSSWKLPLCSTVKVGLCLETISWHGLPVCVGWHPLNSAAGRFLMFWTG